MASHTHRGPLFTPAQPSAALRIDAVRDTLKQHGQEHLLTFWDELNADERQSLVKQIDAINFTQLKKLIDHYVRNTPDIQIPADLRPATYYPRHPGDKYDAEKYRATGEKLIGEGKIAAFTVAGGQGTRLGWNGPKGAYPATPVTGKPLFRVFAEQILATQRKYDVTIPWYIMTSPLNDQDTRDFFLDNNCFGLKRTDIFMFPQGTMPTIEMGSGSLLLADKHTIAVNPDGHGGSIKALADSGSIEDMRSRGVEHICYFQVDNPLVRCVDPLFIGLHAEAPNSSAEMSSKMVAKTDAAEKVGVFCDSDGKTVVIEYSDLPPELKNETNKEGSLRFNAGSIAIHMIGVDFVEKLTEDADNFALPFHRAEKKTPHIDPTLGELVEPELPNAVKLETFVFDAIPLAESSILYETARKEEFAPIKNASGHDSPATSHQLQSDYFGGWLEQRGVDVPRNDDGHVDARIEISPLTALGPNDLKEDELPGSVAKGASIAL